MRLGAEGVLTSITCIPVPCPLSTAMEPATATSAVGYWPPWAPPSIVGAVADETSST